MGLIARHLEAAGIPTVCITSARDITASVNPPRAVFLDFPLGHTSGRVGQPALNKAIVAAALEALGHDTPGAITDLPYHWGEDDGWKDGVMRVKTSPDGTKSTKDDRVERLDTPQYQCHEDAIAAEASHAGQDCLVCAGIDY